jgi:hypothetical protein
MFVSQKNAGKNHNLNTTSPNIVKTIKSRRMEWVVHVACTGELNTGIKRWIKMQRWYRYIHTKWKSFILKLEHFVLVKREKDGLKCLEIEYAISVS